MERYLRLFSFQEDKSKPTMRSYFISFKIAFMKKTKTNNDVEHLESSSSVVNILYAKWQSQAIPFKVKHGVTICLNNSTFRYIYPRGIEVHTM